MIKIYVTVENKNNLITTIPFKGLSVRVEFTGGNVMKNIPAKLYCNDAFVQKALDESDQNGVLYRLKDTIPEEGDKTPAIAQVKNPVTDAQTSGDSKQEPATETETHQEPATEVDGASDKLEFDNLGEAITYVAAHYQVQAETEAQVRKIIDEQEGRKCIIHKG